MISSPGDPQRYSSWGTPGTTITLVEPSRHFQATPRPASSNEAPTRTNEAGRTRSRSEFAELDQAGYKIDLESDLRLRDVVRPPRTGATEKAAKGIDTPNDPYPACRCSEGRTPTTTGRTLDEDGAEWRRSGRTETPTIGIKLVSMIALCQQAGTPPLLHQMAPKATSVWTNVSGASAHGDEIEPVRANRPRRGCSRRASSRAHAKFPDHDELLLTASTDSVMRCSGRVHHLP